MSNRTATVLDRFPRHLDVDGRGKVIGTVVDGLAGGLDVQASQVGRVRRAHRVTVADEIRDLMYLADLHDLSASAFELLRRRLAAVESVGEALADPALDDDGAAVADAALTDLLGLAPGDFGPDEETRTRLAAALATLTGYRSEVELSRRLFLDVVGCHRAGNGSVTSILHAAGAYLHLAAESEVVHSADRFWHVLRCLDRLRVLRPDPAGKARARAVVPIEDVVALEENPFRVHEVFPSARRHGERFSVRRRGWDEVTVTVVVDGMADRTVGPMVVNVDTGVGLAYTGTVPDGSRLLFVRDGRAQLDGLDVAGSCYGFHGAVFADLTATHHLDFVWAGSDPAAPPGPRDATFSVTTPIPNAFDTSDAFPHAGGRLDSPTMSTGESRWAYFVAEAAFAGEDEAGVVLPAAPRFRSARFDASVWATESGPTPTAGEVGFEWEEHEPFAARLWIPRRFASLDGEDEVPVREQVRLLLDRHRPAGVHLYVDYADDRWTLGDGIVRPQDSNDPNGVVVAGTRLWPHPAPPPS